MVDGADDDPRVAPLLAGWGTPPVRPDFAARVLARVEAADLEATGVEATRVASSRDDALRVEAARSDTSGVDASAAEPERVGAASNDARSRRRWAVPFAIGGAVGVLVGASVMTLGDGTGRNATALERPIRLQVPGVAEVVGERGAEVQWERRVDGRIVVDVVEGLAWVRATGELVVVAAGDELALADACARIEVRRGLLDIDATADVVDCALVDDAIDRAELSRREPR